MPARMNSVRTGIVRESPELKIQVRFLIRPQVFANVLYLHNKKKDFRGLKPIAIYKIHIVLYELGRHLCLSKEKLKAL